MKHKVAELIWLWDLWNHNNREGPAWRKDKYGETDNQRNRIESKNRWIWPVDDWQRREGNWMKIESFSASSVRSTGFLWKRININAFLCHTQKLTQNASRHRYETYSYNASRKIHKRKSLRPCHRARFLTQNTKPTSHKRNDNLEKEHFPSKYSIKGNKNLGQSPEANIHSVCPVKDFCPESVQGTRRVPLNAS